MSWSEDAARAATRLPGLTSSDYSSRFSIRGGGTDEVLLILNARAYTEGQLGRGKGEYLVTARRSMRDVVYPDKGWFEVNDQRDFLGLSLEQDWTWVALDVFVVRAGFEAHHERANDDYHYAQSEVRLRADETVYDYEVELDRTLSATGQRLGAYALTRLSLRSRMVAGRSSPPTPSATGSSRPPWASR